MLAMAPVDCCSLMRSGALHVVDALRVAVKDIGNTQGDEQCRGYPEPVADEERDVAHQVNVVGRGGRFFFCFHVLLVEECSGMV